MMDTTGSPASGLIQAGWTVFSRDGEALGEVLGADERRFLIRDGDHPTRRLEISIELVADLDAADMRARLDVDANQVTAEHGAITRVPRIADKGA
jgi:hypothetical protein